MSAQVSPGGPKTGPTPAQPRFGYPRRHYRSTDSTNARARALAESGAPGGLVVTASEQTEGRGRLGRAWFSPSLGKGSGTGGALLYSALLRPLGDRRLLPLAAAVGVCEAAEALTPISCAVKWPNDVWVGGRKLAGILIASRAGDGENGWAVIGVGLNTDMRPDDFPAELRDRATSLKGVAPPAAAVALNESLGRWCDADHEQILEEFRRRDALAGRRLSWEDGSGVARGIDDSGRLLVETAGGKVALAAGEVHLDLEAD